MERYQNLSGRSGVVGYDRGADSIDVYFGNGSVYRYTVDSAGADIIAEMCRLARAGRGLSTFISSVVRENYDRRIR